MEFFGLLAAAAGAFYAGYQRGRRAETIKDTAARAALVSIIERLGEENLSTLGQELKKVALSGLR